MANKSFNIIVSFLIKLKITKIINLLFILFNKNIRIKKEKELYYVYSDSYKIYFYLLERLYIFFQGIEFRFKKLFYEYFLNDIDFEEGDSVVDCGAHLGELLYYFKDKKINYYAFEPSQKLCECIKNNIEINKGHYQNYKIVNKALLDSTGKVTIYLRDSTADTSLEADNFSESVNIDSVRLDEYFNENTFIKLLKIDAEGYEYEVLKGSENILSSIKFIAVDAGFERSSKTESTFDQVNNFLLSKNFILLKKNLDRHTFLYRNSNID